MKLNELRELIEESAKLQKMVLYGTRGDVSKLLLADNKLQKIRKQLNELENKGKLDVELDILKDEINKYFKTKKGVVASNLTYSQYTNIGNINPFSEDEPVYNSSAVGVLTLISSDGWDRYSSEIYKLFDSKARLIGHGAHIYEYDDENDKYFLDEIERVSILDLVPSLREYDLRKTSKIIKKYPEIIDVFYQALEKSCIRELGETRRIVTQMIKDNGLDKTAPKQNYVTSALDLMKEQEQTGFEY